MYSISQRGTLKNLFYGITPYTVTYDAPLDPKTTFRIGGRAQAFFAPINEEELVTVYQRCLEYQVPTYILGGGSNLLITQNLKGVVFSLKNLKQIEPLQPFLRAQCGANLNRLIQYAETLGMGGLENLIGIPGVVGGALSNNAGGRYGSIGDYVFLVKTLDKDGQVRWKNREECQFQYRNSGLKDSLILETVLQLAPDSCKKTLRDKKVAIMLEKKTVQPLAQWSAGCIFKNPEGFSAGRLVDQAGLKGVSTGDAMVSTHHANFIVNRGKATASDVLNLIEKIQIQVEKLENIQLQTEICYWS